MEKEMSKTHEMHEEDTARTVSFFIPKETIGAVIGSGGKVVQEIQRASNTRISIEEKNNQGEVSISYPDESSLAIARARIEQLIVVPDVGKTYTGKVEAIMPYGAFVEFMPGKRGLLHISEISWERLESMDGVLTVGEEIQVQLVSTDRKTGKYRLSRKVLLSKPDGDME